MKNKKLVIGVTALSMVDSPQPGLGVARCLKKEGYKIIGINGDYRTPAICLPYFDEVKVVESLSKQNKKRFLKDLKQIIKSTKMQILIPCYDTEVRFCIKLKKEIESLGIKMLLPAKESFTKSMKENIYDLSNILVPITMTARTKKEIEKKAKKVGWPMVCKGPIKDSYFSKNMKMTKLYCELIRDWWDCDGKVVMQKFVAGDYYSVTGVVDSQHKLAGFVQVQKLGIDLKGATWSGMTIYEPLLYELTLKIIKKLNWVGPFEFEFVKDFKKGKFYLYEINPRFS